MRLSPIKRLLVAALAAAAVACVDPTSVLSASMTVIDGQAQTGTVNQPLAESLKVQIVHNSGKPMEGIAVKWSVESGGGSVSPAVSFTDDFGRAATSRTLGPTVGEQRTRADVDGIGFVRVTHTAVADPGT